MMYPPSRNCSHAQVARNNLFDCVPTWARLEAGRMPREMVHHGETEIPPAQGHSAVGLVCFRHQGKSCPL
jgi:hypothetical protein